MGGYYEALGWHHIKATYPAGALFFEFFRDPSKDNHKQIYVRTYFKETLEDYTRVTINGHKGNILTIEQFEESILARIQITGITNLDDECQKEFLNKEGFYNSETWIEEMEQIYPEIINKSLKNSRIQIQIKKFLNQDKSN